MKASTVFLVIAILCSACFLEAIIHLRVWIAVWMMAAIISWFLAIGFKLSEQ